MARRKPPPLHDLTCHYGHTVGGYGVTPGRSSRCRHVLAPGDERRAGAAGLHCESPHCPDIAARRAGMSPPADGERCGVNIYYSPAGAGSGAGDPRTAVWRTVPPSPPRITTDGLAEAAEPCPRCGGPARKTPRGTLLYCPRCERLAPPARVGARADDRAARAARTADMADPVAELAAQLDHDAAADRLADACERWARALDPDAPVDLSGYDDDLYDDAAALRDRFTRLAAAARRAETPAKLAAVRKLTAQAISDGAPVPDGITGPAKQLHAEVTAARSGVRSAELRAAADDAREDELAAGDLAAAKDRWSEVLASVAALADPAEAGTLAGSAQGWHDALDRMMAEIDSAPTAAVLDAVTQARSGMLSQAHDALAWIRQQIDTGQTVRRELPAPRPSLPSVAERRPTVLDELARYRAAEAARAARMGRCESPHHPVARLLGNAPPVADRIYGGGMVDYYGRGSRNTSAPAKRVCASDKCRTWAEQWLTAQGYPDGRQVYEVLA